MKDLIGRSFFLAALYLIFNAFEKYGVEVGAMMLFCFVAGFVCMFTIAAMSLEKRGLR